MLFIFALVGIPDLPVGGQFPESACSGGVARRYDGVRREGQDGFRDRACVLQRGPG